MRVMKVIKRFACLHKGTASLHKFVRCIFTLIRPRGLYKMSDLFKNVFLYIIDRTIKGTCNVMLHMLKYIPGAQWMHDNPVDIRACPLVYVPNCFKTQAMGIKAVEVYPCQLWDVPDHLKTQGIYEMALRRNHGCWNMSLIILRRRRCAML